MSAKPDKKDENVISHALFQRPPAMRKKDIGEYMTLRNIVMGLGLATFLIFIGSVVSARIAFLFAALFGLTGLVLFEMSTRRKWESEIILQFQKMNGEYERIVREVARNRNDLSALKKNLAEAGSMARSHSKGSGGDTTAEHRMLRAIANQLTKLDVDVAAHEPDEPAIPVAGIEKVKPVPVEDRPLSSKNKDTVGPQLTDAQVLQVVNLAVQQDRIDLFTQAVVSLPQRKLRFYEAFSRIRIKPEVYLPAERYIEVALEQDMVPLIDNLLLLRSLQAVRDAQDDGVAFFCNITSLTLNDPKFMGDLVEFIAQHRNLAPRLVFELGQQDLATMGADTLPVLAGLAQLGCRFSMDSVRSLSFDFAHLRARHVRFVKVEARLLLEETREPGGLARLKRLKAELDRHGVDLIAEKIETDRQLVELLDIEIDYGQGYLFGMPELYGVKPA